jgi:hypothetical protein
MSFNLLIIEMNFLNVFFGEESESEIGLPSSLTVLAEDHL